MSTFRGLFFWQNCWKSPSEWLGWNAFGGLPDDIDGLKMGLEWSILTVCIVWLEELKKKVKKNLKNKNRRHIYEILDGFGWELLGGSSGAPELDLELRESVWCFLWPKSTNLMYEDAAKELRALRKSRVIFAPAVKVFFSNCKIGQKWHFPSVVTFDSEVRFDFSTPFLESAGQELSF